MEDGEIAPENEGLKDAKKDGLALTMNTKTPIWQVKAHEQWVKTVMLSEIVEAGDKVCELCCGKGLDLGKWLRAKVESWTGVDSSSADLKEAEERWTQKQQPFPAQFIQMNLFTENIDKYSDKQFDCICCFDGLQQSFASRDKARNFIKNVASKLKPGGFFFGLVPDSSAIWYKAQKLTSGRVIKGELFRIELEEDTFTNYGTRYTMHTEADVKEFMVHFPSLLKIANDFGLTMLEITNLLEFFEDNRKNYSDLLKGLNVLNKQGKIEPGQKEVSSLYSTFVFQKQESWTGEILSEHGGTRHRGERLVIEG
eukprot:TRINITY_DN13069_c0_g1_i1.p1 TRINITY_DN13069_c0_g1~~TRINITY_DN13069_c0_g1_i1.p1  ORF type:complete len:311 (+),score=42.58 TRINITY_DN13069_c0_g1_i1:44-976(+)